MHTGMAALRRLLAGLLLGFALAASAAPPPAAVDTLAGFAGERRLVLLGEFHGTRETPVLVAELAERFSVKSPVVLALEMHTDEQASLDAYLASDGDAHARAALRSRAFWTREDDQHDGRRSHDMLDLIERMRVLRAEGRDVRLLAYDPGSTGDATVRDAGMARRIRAAFADAPAARMLVLTGNVHAMLERPAFAPHLQVPMGWHLRDLEPASIRITAADGAFWGCYGPDGCGPRAADGAHAKSGPSKGAYTHVLVLPRFAPARVIGGTSVE